MHIHVCWTYKCACKDILPCLSRYFFWTIFISVLSDVCIHPVHCSFCTTWYRITIVLLLRNFHKAATSRETVQVPHLMPDSQSTGSVKFRKPSYPEFTPFRDIVMWDGKKNPSVFKGKYTFSFRHPPKRHKKQFSTLQSSVLNALSCLISWNMIQIGITGSVRSQKSSAQLDSSFINMHQAKPTLIDLVTQKHNREVTTENIILPVPFNKPFCNEIYAFNLQGTLRHLIFAKTIWLKNG